MRVAIIGTGNVGSAIGQAVTAAGHDVIATASSPEKFEDFKKRVDGAETTSSNVDAVRGADAVVLAVPFGAVEEVVNEISGELEGKLVIDPTNPLKPDLSGVATNGTSAAEVIQSKAPGAKVVKAFNTVFASNQASPTVDGTQLDGFVAGDDPEAKSVVSDILDKVGYRPIDVGPLSAARYLEGMAFLNISLNAGNDWSWQSGWKLVGPTDQ
ncbi:MAG: NADPH-dependent F420 reductase [Actinomycetota bacterium]